MSFLAAAANELSETPVAAAGGIASVLSLLLAVAFARLSNAKRVVATGAQSPADRSGLARSVRPIAVMLLTPSMAFGFALAIRLIFQSNWLAGIIAFLVLGVIATGVIAWIAAELLDPWMQDNITNVPIGPTKKGSKRETAQFIGDHQIGDFADNVAKLIAGCVFLLCVGMIAGPWFAGIAELSQAAEAAEQARPNAFGSSESLSMGLAVNATLWGGALGGSALCALFHRVAKTVFTSQARIS